MSSDDELWKRVTDTVTPLGTPGAKKRIRGSFWQEPSVLDLHGYHVQDAYETFLMFVRATYHDRVMIITGRSGIIRYEFEQWITGVARVKNYEKVNEGAFRLILLPR